MSDATDNHHSAAATELDRRAGDGLEVVLLWDRATNGLRVVVDDMHTAETFELTTRDGKEALEAFRHPYAHAAAHGVEPRPARRPGRGAEQPRHVGF